MKIKKKRVYKSIDKRLITEGEKIDFNVYETNDTKTHMTLFLQSNTIVDSDSKVHMREIEDLFIPEEEYDKYKLYAQKHLQSIASDPNIPFAQKADIVYKKAAESMQDLFSNPEALGNLQTSKDLVDGFVSLVLQDDSTIASIMKIAAHDYYTHTHSINVSVYTLSLAQYMGFESEDLEAIGTSSMLHDLGKSKIDWEIINKNGKLTDDEFNEMKKHPSYGYDIAIKMGIKDKRILDGIRSHHEKLNGLGYPDGLKGDEITLFARIIAVCDIFDALTTKRSYKEALTSFQALSIMKDQMQEHLDMDIVNKLIKMFA